MPRYSDFDLDIQNVKVNNNDLIIASNTAYSCATRPGCWSVNGCGGSLEICPDKENENK